ncbi:hypothetical protein D3C80_1911930 [compost metagenome]
MFDGTAAQAVFSPWTAIRIGDEFGHQQQADPFDAGRGIRQAGQHQVHNILGKVLLPPADENLAAGDGITTVRLRDGAGSQQ